MIIIMTTVAAPFCQPHAAAAGFAIGVAFVKQIRCRRVDSKSVWWWFWRERCWMLVLLLVGAIVGV